MPRRNAGPFRPCGCVSFALSNTKFSENIYYSTNPINTFERAARTRRDPTRRLGARAASRLLSRGTREASLSRIYFILLSCTDGLAGIRASFTLACIPGHVCLLGKRWSHSQTRRGEFPVRAVPDTRKGCVSARDYCTTRQA